MQNSPASQRTTIDLLDREFVSLIETLHALTRSVPAVLLYKRPPTLTIGENILKSAGIVEQTFGGITSNLWDDPFEWTLPETLSTTDRILEYLTEVETTKTLAFTSFVDDETLLKHINVPSGEPVRLMELLLQTLTRASEYQGHAAATLKILSDVSPTGFII